MACKPMVEYESPRDLVEWLDQLFPDVDTRPPYCFYDKSCKVIIGQALHLVLTFLYFINIFLHATVVCQCQYGLKCLLEGSRSSMGCGSFVGCGSSLGCVCCTLPGLVVDVVWCVSFICLLCRPLHEATRLRGMRIS